ncbi:MAG: hypothetical protein AB7D05_01600, partial [Mangrovibacterium sp.]
NYLPQKGIFHTCCRLERFFEFMRTAACCRLGVPHFFQQNNVLFSRKLYFDRDGFRGLMDAGFADMELLYNRVKPVQVPVVTASATSLRERTAQTRQDFINQVQKRICLCRDAGLTRRILSVLESLAGWLMAGGMACLLMTEPEYWYLYLSPLVLLVGIQLFIVKSVQNRLKERKIFLSSFIYLLVSPLVRLYQRMLLAVQLQRNSWM